MNQVKNKLRKYLKGKKAFPEIIWHTKIISQLKINEPYFGMQSAD